MIVSENNIADPENMKFSTEEPMKLNLYIRGTTDNPPCQRSENRGSQYRGGTAQTCGESLDNIHIVFLDISCSTLSIQASLVFSTLRPNLVLVALPHDRKDEARTAFTTVYVLASGEKFVKPQRKK